MGKAASGATLILFTTGLGTPTGNPVAPTIKIRYPTGLAKRMQDIIDIDTGGIITGEKRLRKWEKKFLDFVSGLPAGEVIPKAVLLGQG